MDIASIDVLYKECIEKLNSHCLKEALILIESIISQTNNWNLNSEKEDIETSYSMLLNYMDKGAADSQRTKIFQGFIRKCYELADRSYRLAAKPKKNSGYFEALRNRDIVANATFEKLCTLVDENESNLLLLSLEKDSPQRSNAQIKLTQEYAALYSQIFNTLWTDELWSAKDVENMRALFQTGCINHNIRSLIISGITLASISFFDIRKTMFLFEISKGDSSSADVQRSFVGAIMIILIHYKRLSVYPEIKYYIESQSDNTSFAGTLCYLQLQLMMIMETTTIEKQMRDDIIPSMLKNPHFKRTKFGFTEVDEMLKKNDSNPDWENDSALKDIEKKMAQLAELQEKGADVYMGTFSNLKNYPFFSHVANWLYPFDKRHPDISSLFSNKNSFFEAFVSSDALCDSDKYSFCLMAAMIPESQRDMLKAQISQLTEEKDTSLIDGLSKKSVSSDSLRRLYLQDLYRFFCLCNKIKGDINPFKENILLTKISIFDCVLSKPEQLRKLIAFSFKQNNYAVALELYQKLEMCNVLDAEDYQKMGFCFQKSFDYESAIKCYTRADMIKPNSVWTLRHLAQCYRLTNDFENAEKRYASLNAIDSDNLQTLFRHGECLVHLQRYEESFPIFFKVEYLEKNPIKAQRAIGWCSFLTNKLEQANKYYHKIIDTTPIPEDYLNAGHVAWAQGNLTESISHYKHFVEIIGKEKFMSSYFVDDLEILSSHGISYDDICMMVDLIC